MYFKRDVEEHTANHIRSRMRKLARLLCKVRELSAGKVFTLSKMIAVRHFDLNFAVKVLKD